MYVCVCWGGGGGGLQLEGKESTSHKFTLGAKTCYEM